MILPLIIVWISFPHINNRPPLWDYTVAISNTTLPTIFHYSFIQTIFLVFYAQHICNGSQLSIKVCILKINSLVFTIHMICDDNIINHTFIISAYQSFNDVINHHKHLNKCVNIHGYIYMMSSLHWFLECQSFLHGELELKPLTPWILYHHSLLQ